MDVAFVTTRLVDRDAQGNFTEATLKGLQKLCAKVTLFTFAYERGPIEGVDIRYVGGTNDHSVSANLRALVSTGKLARELAGYDLLVLAGPDIGVLPAAHRAKKLNPAIRIVWVYHSLTPAEFLPSRKDRLLTSARKKAYLWSMRKSDKVQVFSQFVRSELLAAGIEDALIKIMPFAIDTKAFAAGDGLKVREKHGLKGSFVLLYVGRLAPAKRVDLLIKAMEQLPDTAALLVVGGGPEKERLEALAKDAGRTIIFAGRVPDDELKDYYAACDAWVTASEHEGFCVPIVEAMAAGRPVIVPASAAMPETASDGGLTYTPTDLSGLVRTIETVMNDRSLCNKLALSARRRSQTFDMDTIMGPYVDLICGGGP